MKKLFGAIHFYFKTIDKLMILICLGISIFSCVIMYSLATNDFIVMRVFYMQIISLSIGLLIAVMISIIDYEILIKLWFIYAPIAIILVLLVYVPSLGFTPTGSDDTAWIRIGSFSFQPSEFLKLAFIYTFSLHLSKVKTTINTLKGFLGLCIHAGIPIVLIMVQGDMGSALVFIAIFLVMIFAAGLSLRFILVVFAGVLISAPLIWIFVLPDYLKERFYIAWDPGSDPLGKGYQQYKGLVALGSGQIFGKGLFADGLLYIPEGHNDFVFAYIGQTLGFVGCCVLSLFITILCVKILFIAKKASDDMGAFICLGVFAIIFFQSIINIGMVVCVLPVIGVTLPFVSGGGTSLMVSFISIGMVLSVHRHQKNDKMFY